MTDEGRAARLKRWGEAAAEALDAVRPKLDPETHGSFTYSGSEVIGHELVLLGWRPPRRVRVALADESPR